MPNIKRKQVLCDFWYFSELGDITVPFEKYAEERVGSSFTRFLLRISVLRALLLIWLGRDFPLIAPNWFRYGRLICVLQAILRNRNIVMGARSIRKGLRRAKPVIRSGALATIGFFNLYLALHYIRLALAQKYGPSLLDETTCLIVLPLAFLFLQDRRAWLPALSMIGYWAVLILGTIIFPNRGVSQPISAILTIALDSKLVIMTFAFAWLFKRTGSATQVFESLCILIIILGLINIPFVFHDLSAGVSIKGNPLEMKGAFVQPEGLFLYQTEVAWLNAFGAFLAATRYRLRKRTLDLMLCALFVMLVCLAVSIKEIVGCFVGLLIIFRPEPLRIWFARRGTCGAVGRCGFRA